ncbi:hypothetical protein [Acidianus brierleyi]|uniref:Nickel/cobalt efflux system n=1 Tax=Acidianus brierleyi TaxID=41673 RepID=A0A2U9ICV1_9CREN|nr:hypothetical protein [Acidianus brierleyi]AWR93855.1 hypothetical protein DFR85_03705 [Acidianus brierleyi]
MRKIWYNLTMTTISILVAYVVGSLELLGLIQSEFSLNGGFWNIISLINGDVWWGNIGMIIITTFASVWILSITIYKVKIRNMKKNTK